ncbi:MAG TPA: 3-deoxy-8-phosphooctulonate synthase [candidate division Zixibacteria bacterium]|nr:3-deoxy-8-phosphooctulonate synthase [candidate division Zixibacteria bacterium]
MIELRKPSGEVRVGDVFIGGGRKWVLIAGPCAIEAEEMALNTAHILAEIADKLDIPFIFKASYDKANRLSGDSQRGVGRDVGLEILAKVRDEVGVPVLTDIHSPEEAQPVSQCVDCIQIPAFLCRQTDIVEAASATGLPINIKKGQFLAPEDMAVIARKAKGDGGVIITERGTSFGYHNLVVDFRGIPIMAESGLPIVMDVTHSLQRPGGEGSSSGGDGRFAPTIATAALAVGVDGLFIEIHPDPENAISDRKTQWPLSRAQELLEFLKAR